MKKLFIIIIIFISFQSWTKADDIRDFELEEMSIEDSALDFFTLKELNENVADYYTSDKFSTSALYNNSIKYDYLQLSFKKNDLKYIIQDLSGTKTMKYSRCIDELDKIESDIESLYQNSKNPRNDGKKTYSHPADKSKETKVTDIVWYFKNGDVIVIQCYNWNSKYGKKLNFVDELKIAVSKEEFDTWAQGEAYE